MIFSYWFSIHQLKESIFVSDLAPMQKKLFVRAASIFFYFWGICTAPPIYTLLITVYIKTLINKSKSIKTAEEISQQNISLPCFSDFN